jgi:hypothetical protein
VILLLPGNPTGHWGEIAQQGQGKHIGWMISRTRPMRKYADNGFLAKYRWAADNECFSQGENFRFDLHLAFMQRTLDYPGDCLFFTVPDVLADAKATRARWKAYAPEMRTFGRPLAYVAQDGLQHLPDVDFDCLFIGGSTAFKLGPTARRLVKQAKAAGKWVHMGRVNGLRRTLYAWKIGVDSIDGTAWAYRPAQEMQRALALIRELHITQQLF